MSCMFPQLDSYNSLSYPLLYLKEQYVEPKAEFELAGVVYSITLYYGVIVQTTPANSVKPNLFFNLPYFMPLKKTAVINCTSGWAIVRNWDPLILQVTGDNRCAPRVRDLHCMRHGDLIHQLVCCLYNTAYFTDNLTVFVCPLFVALMHPWNAIWEHILWCYRFPNNLPCFLLS